MTALVEHGKTSLAGIRSTIGSGYRIDRSSAVLSLLGDLAEHQVVIVSGAAGSGKSALAKDALEQMESKCPVLAFQSVEFATAHIDETLARTQASLSGERLTALLAGQDRKIILIESVERLLEHSVRDAFLQALNLAVGDRSVQVVLTVRDYSLETVRSAFLASAGLAHKVFEVAALTDEELNQVEAAVPSLSRPLQDSQLRSLLRTPYVLDIAARLEWSDDSFPANAREFREKCWNELVRANQFAGDGMPNRREKAFLQVAYKRATKLRPFVDVRGSDDKAIAALLADSLLVCSATSSTLYSSAHDVLEDWAILKWLDIQFEISERLLWKLADGVGGYPAIRRGFRRWLGERFSIDGDGAREMVLECVAKDVLAPHFRDDCVVAALLSDDAEEFVEGCRPKLAENDWKLLRQVIHMLRVACKESPRWLDVPGLPSTMLVPSGAGWTPTLRVVAGRIEELLPQYSMSVLGLVEDWSKQMNWQNPSPDGVQEAGVVVDALLPEFDKYGFDDARKRLLKVMVKIPNAVSAFGVIMEEAKKREDGNRTVSDFVELALDETWGTGICRDLPKEVYSLVNARLKFSEGDLEEEQRNFESVAVECNFGVRDDWHFKCFPASASQGPFLSLLTSHPQDALVFILDLLNHAGDWYGNRRWPGRHLEAAFKVELKIPDHGVVEQWMNGRLYGLYRGMTVGPYPIQSALMALESWLLGIAKRDDVDLESWLLFILKKSNNVMATSVVASVCVANPAKAKRAGLALLTSRAIVELDRERLAQDRPTALSAAFGLNPSHRIYEKERENANNLDHRKEDLLALAVRMQLTDSREAVWEIIDRHLAEMPEDQDEETRVWRLALHRMDVRNFEQLPPPDAGEEEADKDEAGGVYFGPGRPDPDIQKMIDESVESAQTLNRHLGLQNRAMSAWENRESEDAQDWRSALLSEARAIEQELGDPELFVRDGPGLVAAICIRDHLEDLNSDEFEWCARRVEFEVYRHADSSDEANRLGRGMLRADRACASVIPILMAKGASATVVDTRSLLSLVLTHPIDELADYASEGAGAFLGDEDKEVVLECAAAAAYRARAYAALREEQMTLPYNERVYGLELADRATAKVRRAIDDSRLDFANELALLDFDDQYVEVALGAILKILGYHPQWEESRDFYSRVTRLVAENWARRAGDKSLSVQREVTFLQCVARFALKLSAQDARRICGPVVDSIKSRPDKIANFLTELILGADNNVDDCFWDLWQDIADRVADAPWHDRLERRQGSENTVIRLVFLGIYWKEDAKHWHRLDGHAHRLDDLARRLPAVSSCVIAYSTYLSTIGQQNVPDAFELVNDVLKKSDGTEIASNSTVAYYLETLLRRFVYSEPHRVKSDHALREAIVEILDALVAGGSSSAYRMRDDFVTPWA